MCFIFGGEKINFFLTLHHLDYPLRENLKILKMYISALTQIHKTELQHFSPFHFQLEKKDSYRYTGFHRLMYLFQNCAVF